MSESHASSSMTTPPKSRLEEIGDESRRRILDAAESLFTERGYERTSFVDVAQRSGISRGSIPWHFKNKEGLLVAVIERALQRWLEPSGEASADELARVLERVKAWMRHPTAAMIYTGLSRALADAGPARASFVEFQQRQRDDLADVLAQGTTFSDADRQTFAALFHGAFLGLHLQWTLDPTVDLDAGIDALGRLLGQTIRNATR